MSKAFDDWLDSLDLKLEENVILNMAYISGRAYQRKVDAVKVVEYFKPLRFDECHHLGLGDVRITIGQVEELAESIREQKID